jgi:hypothetical protein
MGLSGLCDALSTLTLGRTRHLGWVGTSTSSSIAVVQNRYSNNMVISVVCDMTDAAEGHETVWQAWLLIVYLHRILESDTNSLHYLVFCKINITLTTDPQDTITEKLTCNYILQYTFPYLQSHA